MHDQRITRATSESAAGFASFNAWTQGQCPRVPRYLDGRDVRAVPSSQFVEVSALLLKLFPRNLVNLETTPWQAGDLTRISENAKRACCGSHVFRIAVTFSTGLAVVFESGELGGGMHSQCVRRNYYSQPLDWVFPTFENPALAMAQKQKNNE